MSPADTLIAPRVARAGALALALSALGCNDYSVTQLTHGDSFQQLEPEDPIDILWIIDNSGTMSEEQDQLVDNFRTFTEVLYSTSVEFHIGVTTTDVEEEAGALVGEVLTRETEDLEDLFVEQAAQGTMGSRDEMPLEAVRLATTTARQTGYNADFFRDDAELEVIILSDEDDQSPDPVETYLDELVDSHPDTGFDISAIAGGEPAGCNSVYGSAEAGSRIIAAVEGSSGEFASICEADYEPVMAKLALASTGMTDTFELSALPDLESMEVYVDGVLMHMRPQDGWRYDASDNAVVFDGLAIPRPGQVVEVQYIEITASDEAAAK